MTARDVERKMLMRCVVVAHTRSVSAMDKQEANVFRVASMVVQHRFPGEAVCLMKCSEAYFRHHPNDRLSAVDVVRKGWVFSLPRLHDMLSAQLLKDKADA
jgi:hypothetical protein